MKYLQKLAYIALGAAMTLALGLTVPTLASGADAVVKTLTAYFTVGGNPISIYVDGEKITITQTDSDGNVVQPFVSDGATYLPVKTVAEVFGKTATWDGATASVYIGAKPGETQYMTDVLPAYQTGTGNNNAVYREYSEIKSGGSEKFEMAGVSYLNGILFRSGGHFPEKDWAIYNLDGKYSQLSGILGHRDGVTYNNNGTLQIYLDGVLKAEYELAPDMPPKNIALDVSGALQMKFVWNTGDWVNGTETYGFGNPILK